VHIAKGKKRNAHKTTTLTTELHGQEMLLEAGFEPATSGFHHVHHLRHQTIFCYITNRTEKIPYVLTHIPSAAPLPFHNAVSHLSQRHVKAKGFCSVVMVSRSML
jgi:hypothetical protein